MLLWTTLRALLYYVNIVLTDTLYNIDIVEDEIYLSLFCVT